mgnify:CR=1 FL=1
MNAAHIRQLIQQGEGISVEFKKSSLAINRDVYETVGAFLNRCGGELLLGVANDGSISGIAPDKIEQLKTDFVTSINNPQVINPSTYLNIETVQINGNQILYIFVPESSQVHRCRGKIFDRNEDGDLDITNNTDLVSSLYLRKQKTYSENEIFPIITIDDFEISLIHKARQMAVNNQANHPWQYLSDMDLLKSSGLYLKDYKTGQEGFTLACVLLFGKDEVIHSVLPHHRTDAILRKINLDRYDDRDDIRINLIDSFDRIMQFAQKHLPDPFYTEDSQRISVRDKIVRELASNILIHREYRNAFPAKFIIEADRIFVENSNKPHGFGIIDVQNFTPYPKNPTIAKVFKEIGRADELGSGTRNLIKYSKFYSDQPIELKEGDVFATTIHISDQVALHGDHASDHASDQVEEVLEFCRTPRSRKEIQAYLGLKNRDHFRREILNPLIENKILHLTIPGKPSSPKQLYYTSKMSITKQAAMVNTMPVTMQADQVKKVLELCKTPRSRKEIQEHLGLKNKDYFRKAILNPLIENKKLEPTIPQKPNSPKQKYIVVNPEKEQ